MELIAVLDAEARMFGVDSVAHRALAEKQARLMDELRALWMLDE